MKINRKYRKQLEKSPHEGIYDLDRKEDRKNLYNTSRTSFKISKRHRKKKLETFSGVSAIVLYLAFIGTGIYVNWNEINKFNQIPEVVKLDSTYQSQKEFYEDKLDSLKQDYEIKLNKLERGLEWERLLINLEKNRKLNY